MIPWRLVSQCRGRGEKVPLDTIGQFICTLPCILKMNKDETISDLLQRIKFDIIEKLDMPELALGDFLKYRKYRSPMAFDSLVVIENYPITFNGEIDIIDYSICEKASFNVVLGVIFEQGKIALQYDSAQFDNSEVLKMASEILNILENVVYGKWKNVRDTAKWLCNK